MSPDASSTSHGVNLTDTAGVPWAGRTLGAQPFAGDDGTRDQRLTLPMVRVRAEPGDLTALAELVRIWATTRVMVPVVAVLGAGEPGAPLVPAHSLGAGDKSADMALAGLVGQDGRRGLPVFTSTEELVRWDSTARPVPVEAARAAQAAVVEGYDDILVDFGSEHAVVLPRPVVWAVAQGRSWVPPAQDEELQAAVTAIVRAVPGVPFRTHHLEPAGAAGVVLVLGIAPGLHGPARQEAFGRLSEALQSDETVTERVASLRITHAPGKL